MGSVCHSKRKDCVNGRWFFAKEKWQTKNYGGQRNAAPMILKHLPKAPVFVEPFAGHAYVAQRLWKDPATKKVVLGDINCEATDWLKKARNVPGNTIIKCPQDWKKTVAQTDSKETLTFFDPPWEAKGKGCYDKYNGNCRKPGMVEAVIDKAKTLKGDAAIILRDTPEYRELLCHKPFTCIPIHGVMKGYGGRGHFRELLGVKK
jgi:site-specific DNA-adenine methylase